MPLARERAIANLAKVAPRASSTSLTLEIVGGDER